MPWLHWCLHHDEDVEVHVDGTRVLALTGWTQQYEYLPVDAAARAPLTPGRHLLAVHCKQTGGGQYIDVGLGYVLPRKPADVAPGAERPGRGRATR